MRTIVDFPDDMIRTLDRLGGGQKRPRAALIREAISEYLDRKTPPAAPSAFGIWKDRPKDGLQYEQEIRDEWEAR